ncbi:helix-turn-helix transcriptional regulator [Haloprofundus halobius]|uniref:helix-turn-helix transcriptional regulator n=1 Tax=Haloprofundus halobius TaxID=2876194 RepID=UPI001CC94FD9|nr:helix-turn-helix transcriptional regulator [Haloprofundus halobius]
MSVELTELSGFQRDLLTAAVSLDSRGERVAGADIKEIVEERLDGEVNHGRLYPNLDTLFQKDLIERGMVDRRTNSYQPTARGRQLVSERGDALATLCDCAGVHHVRPVEETDAGVRWASLAGFQRDLLVAIGFLSLGESDIIGLDVRDRLGEQMGVEITNARLYTNLDVLVEPGLVAKGSVDGRSNSYELTADAWRLIRHQQVVLEEATEVQLIADGGDEA